MHKIDLLRGSGLPAKTTFGGTVIIAFTVIIPIIVFAAMLDRYLQNKGEIEFNSREIARFENKISEYAPDVQLHNEALGKRVQLVPRLSELSRCVDTFFQWSPVLVTVVQELPGEMIINELSAQSQIPKVMPTGEAIQMTNIEIPVPERSLQLDVSGRGQGNNDNFARAYQASLESSEYIEQRLNHVDFSREPGRFGNEQIVSYKMNFIFENKTK